MLSPLILLLPSRHGNKVKEHLLCSRRRWEVGPRGMATRGLPLGGCQDGTDCRCPNRMSPCTDPVQSDWHSHPRYISYWHYTHTHTHTQGIVSAVYCKSHNGTEIRFEGWMDPLVFSGRDAVDINHARLSLDCIEVWFKSHSTTSEYGHLHIIVWAPSMVNPSRFFPSPKPKIMGLTNRMYRFSPCIVRTFFQAK